MEGRTTVDGLQVHVEGGAMSNPGGAGGPREPMVLAGVKGGRSGQGAKAMGQGELEHSEAEGGVTDYPCPGGGGSQQAQGIATPLRSWGGTEGLMGDSDERLAQAPG